MGMQFDSLRSILVPVDGSDGALRGVRYAAGLAKAVGASVTLLYVYDSTEIAALGIMVAEVDDVAAIENQARRAALDSAGTEMGGVSYPPKKATLVGNPAEQIVTYAKDHNIDLIVMGNRGRSQFGALLLGGVSDKVVHHAHCPVLIVR